MAGSAYVLPRATWMVCVTGIGFVVGMIFLRWGVTIRDSFQQFPLMYQLSHGHLSGALGSGASQHARIVHDQTAGPGFGLLTPVFWAAVRAQTLNHSVSNASYGAVAMRAMNVSAVCCLALLASAWVAASRAVGVAKHSVLELFGLAAVVTSWAVLACYLEAFHPADVLCLAGCLAAFTAATRGRLGWTAVWLGLALATKQWGLVPIGVLGALHQGRDRWTVWIGSIAVFVLFLLPFYLTGPKGTMTALGAHGVVRGGLTAAGLLPLPKIGLYLMSRVAPIAFAAVVSIWIVVKKARFSVATAVPALAATLAFRPVVDPAGLLYYAAPGLAFFVLMLATSWRQVLGASIGMWLLRVRQLARGYYFYFRGRSGPPPCAGRHRLACPGPSDDSALNIVGAIGTTAALAVPVVWGLARLAGAARADASSVEPEPAESLA